MASVAFIFWMQLFKATHESTHYVLQGTYLPMYFNNEYVNRKWVFEI